MYKFNHLTDEELLENLPLGGTAIFQEIHQRYVKRIQNKCFLLLQDEDLAKDLTQEIFIKLFLGSEKFKNQAKFSTWIYTMTYNLCIDHIRKHKKTKIKYLTSELREQLENIVDDSLDIETEITTETLELLFKNISEEEKMILLLKYQDGMMIKQISEVLQLSESAVKMRLKRAKDKLRLLYLNANILSK